MAVMEKAKGMKLLDWARRVWRNWVVSMKLRWYRYIDSEIQVSVPVQELATGMQVCAEEVTRLIKHNAVLHHNQGVQQRLLMQIFENQRILASRLKDSSLDVSMPDIGDKPVDTKDEAAKLKAAAALKPN